MSADKNRYALFSNGSFLSKATLQALLDADRPPQLIVLPEYPPARSYNNNEFGLLANQNSNPLLALAADIPVAYAPKARQLEVIKTLQHHDIDLMLVACWPYLIAPEIVDALDGAALNLHPSLLPAFRGPNPVEAQLNSNDRQFGVSLHRLSNNFDAGDLVAQLKIQAAKKSPDRQMVEQDCAKGGVQLFVTLLDQNPALWPTRPQAR